jgi:hypothetical protein
VTEEDLEYMKQEIEELDEAKIKEEKMYRKLVQRVQATKKAVEHDVNVLSIKFKEKD